MSQVPPYLSLLFLGGTGLVYCGTGWYLVVLGQTRAVLVASVICFQKIYGFHGVHHHIIKYSEKEKVMTDRQIDRQTDRISYLRLDPFCGRGRGKSALQICEVDNEGHDLMF